MPKLATVAAVTETIERCEKTLRLAPLLSHYTGRLVRVICVTDYVPSVETLTPAYAEKVSAVDISKHHMTVELLADLEAHVELFATENEAPLAHERSADDTQVLVETEMLDKPTTDAWGTW